MVYDMRWIQSNVWHAASFQSSISRCKLGPITQKTQSVNSGITTARGIFLDTVIRSAASQSNALILKEAELRVWEESELAVSIYPSFRYNAIGAGGLGSVIKCEGTNTSVCFDTTNFTIPPLDYRSARVLGIPIPPPLKIDIDTKTLEGVVGRETGKVELDFVAEFFFTIGSLYQAPPLLIKTTLTTETSTGELINAEGDRLVNGCGKLVGVAQVPKTKDWFLNGFLMLPTEALARLAVEIKFS